MVGRSTRNSSGRLAIQQVMSPNPTTRRRNDLLTPLDEMVDEEDQGGPRPTGQGEPTDQVQRHLEEELITEPATEKKKSQAPTIRRWWSVIRQT